VLGGGGGCTRGPTPRSLISIPFPISWVALRGQCWEQGGSCRDRWKVLNCLFFTCSASVGYPADNDEAAWLLRTCRNLLFYILRLAIRYERIVVHVSRLMDRLDGSM